VSFVLSVVCFNFNFKDCIVTYSCKFRSIYVLQINSVFLLEYNFIDKKSKALKNSNLLLVLTILFCSCATINKMSNEAIHHAIVGQNEMVVHSRLGLPVRTIQTPDGGKKLIYELHSKGMFTTPYKSRLTFDYSGDMANQEPHLNWRYSNINTETNKDEYTIYQEDTSFLEVFLNNEGHCVRFQHNMTRSQLEQLYERFKQYIPKD